MPPVKAEVPVPCTLSLDFSVCLFLNGKPNSSVFGIENQGIALVLGMKVSG